MHVTLQVSPESGALGPGEEAAMQVHFCPQEVVDCDRWAVSHDLEEHHSTVAWYVGYPGTSTIHASNNRHIHDCTLIFCESIISSDEHA